jgi:4-hydroxybenzoate polyprenyltransferase
MGSIIPTPDSPSRAKLRQLGVTLEMIQFEHTVFALPFALMGAVLAQDGFRRAGAALDLLNGVGRAPPRVSAGKAVAGPPLLTPTGDTPPLSGFCLELPRLQWRLVHPLCGHAEPIGVHSLVPGLGINPGIFVHQAVYLGGAFSPRRQPRMRTAWSLDCRPRFNSPPLVLGLAVLCWTAGFDVIYACQDIDFDRREGLYSIPWRWGVARTLLFARLLHVFMLLALVVVGRILSLGSLYYTGVGVTGLLLAYEHSLIRADDLSRVNRAFTVNGVSAFCCSP